MFQRICRMDVDDLGGLLTSRVTDVQNGIDALRGPVLCASLVCV